MVCTTKNVLLRIFLLDCSGLLPILGHVIGISQRGRRGSGIGHFGAKETQPLKFQPALTSLVLITYAGSKDSDVTSHQHCNVLHKHFQLTHYKKDEGLGLELPLA